jgi:hypothetical protein
VFGWVDGVMEISYTMESEHAQQHGRTAGSHAKTARLRSRAAPLAKLAWAHARRAPEEMAEVKLAGEVQPLGDLFD